MNAVQVQGFILAKRAPVVGDVDNFSYAEEPSRSGKPYTRVRRNTPEYGGSLFKVLEATPTGKPADAHGNLGYNITLAATTEEYAVQGIAPGVEYASHQSAPSSREDGMNWGLALKLASYALHPAPGTSHTLNVEEYIAAVTDLAVKFYPVVQAGAVSAAQVAGPTPADTGQAPANPEPQVEQEQAIDTVAPPPADDDIPF